MDPERLQLMQEDLHRHVVVVDDVHQLKDDEESDEDVLHFDVKCEGLGFYLPCPRGVAPPAAGDRLVLFSRSIRGPIRGAAILSRTGAIDRVFYYDTEEESQAKRELEKAARQRDQEDQFNREEADLRRRIAVLPDVFQDRFARFERYGGQKWMINILPYELMVCEQAVALEGTVDDILGFAEKPQAEQLQAFPGLDEGHSGNSFAATVHMAHLFRNRPDLVPFEHAAIHALLGCTVCCCYAARKAYTGETLPIQKEA